MFIIELKIKNDDQWFSKWIAGICSQEQEVQQLFDKIPFKDRVEKKLHSLPGLTYLFFIVEDAEKFTFVSSKDELSRIAQRT